MATASRVLKNPICCRLLSSKIGFCKSNVEKPTDNDVRGVAKVFCTGRYRDLIWDCEKTMRQFNFL